jgi:hypothetical protein
LKRKPGKEDGKSAGGSSQQSESQAEIIWLLIRALVAKKIIAMDALM